jgi:hypothetical protein
LMNLKKFDLETPNCTCRIDKLMEWEFGIFKFLGISPFPSRI